MPDDTLHDKLDHLRLEQTVLTQAIETLSEHNARLTASVMRLVEILTPETSTGGGELRNTLAALAAAVQTQNQMLDDLGKVLVRFVREIPPQVATAVLSGSSGLLAAVRDLPGRVVTAVREAIR